VPVEDCGVPPSTVDQDELRDGHEDVEDEATSGSAGLVCAYHIIDIWVEPPQLGGRCCD
jgi:hypothetical protein